MENYKGHRRNLYLTSIIASVGYTAAGSIFSWTSPTLPRLKAPGSRIPINDEEGSWIASLIAIGATIGPLVSGKILDTLGRKWTILLDTVLLLIAWVILGLATCVEMLYVGRFIAGFSVGLLFTGVPLYISEVSDDESRGMLSSTMEFSLAIGFNLEYFGGPYLSYIELIIASSVIPLLYLLTFFWVPETPYFLIAKGKKDKAIKSLQWLRGNISLECAEKEMVIIESTMYEMIKKKESFWTIIKQYSNRKAMGITLFLMLGQQFTGINVLQLYAESIFISSGTEVNPAYCTILFGIFQFISSTMAAPITKRFGYRKPLLMASILIAFDHFILGWYLYFLTKGKDVSFVNWIPLVCIISYIFIFSATFGPLPWAIMGEMFPLSIKGAASGIVAAFAFFLTFVLAKCFTTVTILFGIYTSFFIFSISSAISFCFILFVLPDTKGMSLQQVQDVLNNQVIIL